jgi:hypothetical protein
MIFFTGRDRRRRHAVVVEGLARERRVERRVVETVAAAERDAIVDATRVIESINKQLSRDAILFANARKEH